MKWSVVAIALTACSQGGLTGKAPPQAILDLRIDQADGNACEVAGTTATFGDFADGGEPIPVTDGSGSGANSIGCTVRDRGDKTFEVTAEIKVKGNSWLFVAGTVPSTYDKAANPNGVGGLRASFSNGLEAAALRTYGENDNGCLLQYRSDAQGVTGGRIWGHITCPRAAPGALDAGDATKTCTVSAQLRFENCGL